MMQTGKKIRDYVLESKIGEGGMGEVWRARHLVLDRMVAIKAMSKRVATDPEFEARFVQEARAQAKLEHPRILGVSDFFVHEKVYYLVMPLIEGESLEDLLIRQGGPLPLATALIIASDLLDALDNAHRKGIIHRDVKPSNILLDRKGRAYLMDFGIALLVGEERKTRTGTSLGTPHYMSPEQIRHPKSIDHRTDVYSVGCVLYEMLAGHPPFLPEEHGDTDYQVKEAHLYRYPAPIRSSNPSVDEGLDNLVLRALAKDPAERYGGCGDFRKALDVWKTEGRGPDPPVFRAPPGRPPDGPGGVPFQQSPSVPAYRAAQGPPPAPPTVKKGGSRTLWFILGGTAGCFLLAGLVVVILVGIGAMIEEGGSESSPSSSIGDSEPLSADDEPSLSVDELFRAQIEDFLEDMEQRYVAQGYERSHDPYIAHLEPGQSNSVNITLTQEKDYVIVGVCDTDCDDLDLRLLDENGNEIDVDTAADDFPIVRVAPIWTGSFEVEIDMYSCDQSPCYYGIGIFSKGT